MGSGRIRESLDVHGGLVQMGQLAGMSADQVGHAACRQCRCGRAIKQVASGRRRRNTDINGTPTFVINGQSHGRSDYQDDLQEDP